MELKNKTVEEITREIQFREMLLASAKKRCAPLEKNVRESMGEKYPLGMTPEDIANEIEANVEDAGYTIEMPNINLSTADDIEGAIIEGQTRELMDALLLVAAQAQNIHIATKSFELYNQLEAYEQIEPAKMRTEKDLKELKKLELQEEYLEMKEEALEEKDEMSAAIKEDEEELRATEQEVRDIQNESQKEKKSFKSPHRYIKEVLGLDIDR